jgi:hypothetical protein
VLVRKEAWGVARGAERGRRNGDQGMLTRLLGPLDQSKGGTVLHTSTRVHEFSLAENLGAGRVRERLDPDLRRVSAGQRGPGSTSQAQYGCESLNEQVWTGHSRGECFRLRR